MRLTPEMMAKHGLVELPKHMAGEGRHCVSAIVSGPVRREEIKDGRCPICGRRVLNYDENTGGELSAEELRTPIIDTAVVVRWVIETKPKSHPESQWFRHRQRLYHEDEALPALEKARSEFGKYHLFRLVRRETHEVEYVEDGIGWG